jgi:hypothetical protein
MRAIFERVNQNADVLDMTFSEHFSIEASREPPGYYGGPTPRASPTHAGDRPQSAGRARATTDGDMNDNRDNRQSVQAPPTASRHTPPVPPPASNHHIGTTNDLTREIPRCTDHGVPCVERTVTRESANKGRAFFACSLPREEQCNFFEWVTPEAGESTGRNRPASSGAAAPPPSASAFMCTGHNEPCVERTVVRDNGNKGRVFFSCPRPMTESCGFFLWKDEAEASNQAARGGGSAARAPPPSASSADAPSCKGHQQRCVVRTARTGANVGREFFSCPRPMVESCGYFLWKDEFDGGARRSHSASTPPEASRGRGLSPAARASTSAGASSNSSRSSAAGSIPTCECGQPCVQLVSRTEANKGRVFFKCSGSGQENQCRFFEWAP